jgi:hypothetical protein
MRTSAAHERAEEPLPGISPEDAASIIKALGSSIVEAYGTAGGGVDTPQRNAWGSKQREQLLRALINRVAKHARSFSNAALSATDAAITAFARREFEERNTRSDRDRAPITKNVDKLVGGWLRRFGRVARKHAITVSMVDDVDLKFGRHRIRLFLTFAYPWRVVRERRLLITARFEELLGDGNVQTLQFRSDPDAVDVTLPERRRRYTPAEAQHLRLLLESMKSFAELTDDPELAAYVDRGVRAFVPMSAVKVLLICFFAASVASSAFPQTRQLLHRVYDALRSSETLPEFLRKLRVDSDEAVFVSPEGHRSSVAVSGSGSQVRLSPGASRELMHIAASITDRDLSEISDLLVPLSDLRQVGINAVQYRDAAHQPIVPWVIEVLVMPEQDPELAAELAARTASIDITYDPPLPKAELARQQNVSMAGRRVTLTSELRELPHLEQTYAVTATVRRRSGMTAEHRAQLRVDAKGLATLQRERATAVVAVPEDVRVGHPICTTILHDETYPMFIPGQEDYVQALAKMNEEQRVILLVYPLSRSPSVDEVTVDWGDGGKADQQMQKGLFTLDHTYRVGDRAYPITIYFKGSREVFKFDLYVFKSRGPSRRTPVIEYVTPYPPNPEVTSLAELPPDEQGEVFVSVPVRPVNTESITFSVDIHREVWQVPLSRGRTARRVEVRYVARDGEAIEILPW